MTFNENIAVLKSHIDDLEAQLKRLEEKKVKSSGAKARSLLLKIKTIAHDMRKDVLVSVKEIPTKPKKNVTILDVLQETKDEVPKEAPPTPQEEQDKAPPPKKKRVRKANKVSA